MLRDAEQAFAAEQYADALRLYEKLVVKFRENGDCGRACLASISVVECLKELDDEQEVAPRVEDLTAKIVTLENPDEACLCGLHLAEVVSDETESVAQILRKTADSAEKSERSDLRSLAFERLGDALDNNAEVEEAGHWLERAATEAEALPPCSIRNRALARYARWLCDQGETEEALGRLREVLQHEEHFSDTSEVFEVRLAYAEALYDDDEDSDWQAWAFAAIELLENIEDVEQQCLLRSTAANLLNNCGSREEAVRQYVRAARDVEAISDLRAKFAILSEYGEALRKLGAWENAAEVLAAGARLPASSAQDRQRLDLLLSYAGVLLALENAGVLSGLDEPEKAKSVAEEALGLAESSRDSATIARAAATYAGVLTYLEDFEAAEREFAKALESAARSAAVDLIPAILVGYGNVLRATGKKFRARELFVEALGSERGNTDAALRCLVENRLLEEALAEGDCAAAWDHARRGRQELLRSLQENPLVRGVTNTMALYHRLFSNGLSAAETMMGQTSSSEERRRIAWQVLGFLDSAKCVVIQLGLRRHLRGAGSDTQRTSRWESGPPNWQLLFPQAPYSRSGHAAAIRGSTRSMNLASSWNTDIQALPQPTPDLANTVDSYSQFATRDDVRELLHDGGSVILHFYFDAEDLLVLPVYLDPNGVPQVLMEEGNPFRIRNCRSSMTLLVRDQVEAIDGICKRILYRKKNEVPSAAMFGAMSFNLTNIYSRAMITMEGNRLLDLLRSKVGPLEDVHLTIIPDGPLYELPVHAFPVARPARAYTPRVYEVFASVTYSLSLRTLQIQKSVEAARSELDSQDSVLKGVFMGNPDGLEHVRSEAQTFIRLTGKQSWWLHGKTSHEGCQTSLENFRNRHGTGNLLWISGHGVRQTEELGGSTFEEPALILVDGYLWLSEVLSGAYDFSSVRLIILNACWLGRIDPDRGHSKEVESYNAIMALRGCRRITSAMWPVYDEAALVFATAYVAALRSHVFSGSTPINPHGASSALRDALSALRRHDNGRFDHEYFWAPYTLYGLG